MAPNRATIARKGAVKRSTRAGREKTFDAARTAIPNAERDQLPDIHDPGTIVASMGNESAGILMYKRQGDAIQVLLAHPGGPFWRRRDEGAWTIPKGEPAAGETAEAAARREFEEELGTAPAGPLQPLGRIRQRGGKWVAAFALQGDFDVAGLRSNTCEMEWPPRSGRFASFPEVDRAGWFAVDRARRAILPSQAALLDRLLALLGE